MKTDKWRGTPVQSRQTLLDWQAAGHIDANDLDAALALAGAQHSADDWLALIRRLLLWLGALAIAIGVVFFFAFNWDGMHRLHKFALLGAVLLATALMALWIPRERMLADALAASLFLLIGALLALNGQVYQTGADTWQLFVAWAAAGLPLALVVRRFAVWVIWQAVANVGLLLFFEMRRFGWWFDEQAMLLGMAALNTAAALVWLNLPVMMRRPREREWLAMLSLLTAGSGLTWFAMHWVVSFDRESLPGTLAWLGLIGSSLWWYGQRSPNLIMVASVALSVGSVVVAASARLLHRAFDTVDAITMLLLASEIVALAWLAGVLLHRWHKGVRHA